MSNNSNQNKKKVPSVFWLGYFKAMKNLFWTGIVIQFVFPFYLYLHFAPTWVLNLKAWLKPNKWGTSYLHHLLSKWNSFDNIVAWSNCFMNVRSRLEFGSCNFCVGDFFQRWKVSLRLRRILRPKSLVGFKFNIFQLIVILSSWYFEISFEVNRCTFILWKQSYPS